MARRSQRHSDVREKVKKKRQVAACRNDRESNGIPRAMEDYSKKPKDTRREKFLVGRDSKQIDANIGGCPYASTLVADSGLYGYPIVIAIACRRWGCSHCGRVRTAQLANNVARAEPNRFITLTTDAKLWNSPREAFDGVRRKLPDFTKAIRKKIGNFEYVRILELHKNGMPHWHLLARSAYIPQQLLSDTWARYTGSVIVDVRAIGKYFNAVRYVTKYLTKVAYIEWTTRRVSWSKDFFPDQPKTDQTDWQLENKRLERRSPWDLMQQEFTFQYANKIGNYAWLMKPYMKPSQAVTASVAS